ncbi:LysM peptidoglycan-binding domain-containing protein [Hyphomicrobium denitrificans]|nr:LysM peptidoglycan-binding domain-containing protein [Hyphomicrobium denitrificans]
MTALVVLLTPFPLDAALLPTQLFKDDIATVGEVEAAWIDPAAAVVSGPVVRMADAGGVTIKPNPAPPVETAKPHSEDKPVEGLGIADRVQDWLARANREFQATVIPRLSTPVPGGLAVDKDSIARKLEDVKDQDAKAAEAARRAEEALKAEKAKKAEEARRAAEETKRIEEARKAEEAKQAADLRKTAEEAKRAEEQRKIAEEAKRAEEARKLAEEARQAEEAKRIEEARKAEEARQAAEAKREEEARKAAEEAKRVEDERKAAEAAKQVEEARKAAEAKQERERLEAEAARAEAQRQAAEAQRKADEAKRLEDERAKLAAEKAAEERQRTAAVEAEKTQQQPDASAAPPPVPEPGSAESQKLPGTTSGVESDADLKQAPPPRSARIKVASRRLARGPVVRRWIRRAPRCRFAGRRIMPPGHYTVQSGDTLWRISRRHYRAGRLYWRLYHANRSIIRNPNLIYPCQRIFVPRRR